MLDVGTGSGILAIWAAQAGARRVYAVEYTDMAKHAAKLVAANKMDHIVEVIQGSVEEIELPEKGEHAKRKCGRKEAAMMSVVGLYMCLFGLVLVQCGYHGHLEVLRCQSLKQVFSRT